MTEHDAPTEAELEDLALDLEEFCEERSPRQQAVLKDLLSRAADNREDVTGGGSDERSVSTARHAEREAADQGTPYAPAYTDNHPLYARTFYVMGVPLFQY